VLQSLVFYTQSHAQPGPRHSHVGRNNADSWCFPGDRWRVASAGHRASTPPVNAGCGRDRGVTEAILGVADYGSLVIPTTRAGIEPVGLFADQHIAVLPEADIVSGMAGHFVDKTDCYDVSIAVCEELTSQFTTPETDDRTVVAHLLSRPA